MISTPRRRATSLRARLGPICTGLSLIDEGEHALGIPESKRYAEELYDRMYNLLGSLSDQQADSLLRARYAEKAGGRFVVYAVTDGRPGCAALVHEHGHPGWRLETTGCARCGLVVVDRTADGAHGRYCGPACRQGTVTPAMREAALRSVNETFRKEHDLRGFEGTPLAEKYLAWYNSPEHAEAWEPNWPGLGDTDPHHALLDGLDWPTTWQLRGELPPSLAIFALIDGSGLVQDGFSDYRFVADFRAEIVRHRMKTAPLAGGR